MNREVGLWIDHREAVIAFVALKGKDKGKDKGNGIEIQRIESDLEKHVRFSGGAAAVTEEDIRDRRFANHLHKYYDEVIALIRDADSILILGPGEAKVELKTRLESQHLGAHIVGLETVDKMTENQVAAMVREHFHTMKGFRRP